MHGQLESATREVWVVEDTAEAVEGLLTKIEDAEGLDRLVIQLAEVQRSLNDLRRYLDIPRGAEWLSLRDQWNGRLPATEIWKRKKGAIMLVQAKALNGYKLHSLDGDIGSTKEFYFDDRYWAIRYLVANTGNWLTGRKVLISPYSLNEVSPTAKEISVQLTKK
jgi:hypothetical protein